MEMHLLVLPNSLGIHQQGKINQFTGGVTCKYNIINFEMDDACNKPIPNLRFHEIRFGLPANDHRELSKMRTMATKRRRIS